jgi:hypothetical protein
MLASTCGSCPPYQQQRNSERTQNRFISSFTYLFHQMMSFGDRLKEFDQHDNRQEYPASETFKNCVRQSMRINCDSSAHENQHQFNVTISAKKLSDLLSASLPQVASVNELVISHYDIEVIFRFSGDTNRVSHIKSFRPAQIKEAWLENVLIQAIEAMDNSIVFADLED